MFSKIKSWSLKKKIIVGAIAFVVVCAIVGMSSDDDSDSSAGGKGKNTIAYLRSQNTDGARIWADFIQAYGINASDEENLTILQLAVQQNNSDLVATCIKDKADVNRRVGNTVPPFILAVRKGNYEIAKQLLDAGALIHPVYEKDESHFDLFAVNEFDALAACPFSSPRPKENEECVKLALLLIPRYKGTEYLDHFDSTDSAAAYLARCFYVNGHLMVNKEIVNALIQNSYRPSEEDITGSDGLVKMYFKYNGTENDESVETAWNTLTTYLKQSEYKERYANIIRYAYRACLEDFTYEYFSQGRESKIFEKSLAFIDFLLSNGYSATDKDGYSPDTFVEKFLWRTENEGVPFAEQIKATFAKHGITVN